MVNSDLLECYPDATSLQKAFHDRYPHITVSRADQFYHTVKRISAPCKSERVACNFSEEYRSRIWKPRIRNIAKGKLINILMHLHVLHVLLFVVCIVVH